ncbi:MAG: bifunctional 5,10-methylene-tetrahydrofolate dehydrogenase/5,10-methylene-tetrahydrofolate cyclohydrolase [Planctomycetota bacterium]|nr:MAG: bifunctional 5,10-methylene-tetrahydrofolate dehydrogenase/5,10-methylene-tetrahydrofolate cyclohydrolase [Planctomycetota bacterium]
MTAELIRGAPVAKLIRRQVEATVAGASRPPCLLNVVLGQRGDQAAYLSALDRAAARRGMTSRRLELPEDLNQAALCEAVTEAGADPGVDGLMIQLPLPKGLDRQAVTACVPAAKDVDGASWQSMGAVLSGARRHTAPATAAAVVELLSSDERLHPAGRHVVVVGRSLVVGRPLAAMLVSRGLGGDATVTTCHTRTPDLAAETRRADIIVAAAGVKHLLSADMVSPGAIVIDVGTHAIETDDGPGLTGDVHPDVAEVAGFLTPVPGGVGTVTTAILMRHVAAAACPGVMDPAW